MSVLLDVQPGAPAPHLLRLLGLVGYAHQLTHRAGPFPLAPAARLVLYQAHLGLYAELFEADAPRDTEEIMLVLALLPTLQHLAAELAGLAATLPAAGPLAQRLHADLAALRLRHGITEAEQRAWASGLHSDPEAGPALDLAA